MAGKDLFNALPDYVNAILGCPATVNSMDTIQGMLGHRIFETGVSVAGGYSRVFNKPPGYVPWAEKLEALKQRPDWQDPPR